MKWSLYLDDLRTPSTKIEWVIARSFEEARKLVLERGAPTVISFDHDLGDGVPDGYDFAKWIVESDLDGLIKLPEDFRYNVHSANPPGAANIESLMASYLRHKKANS